MTKQLKNPNAKTYTAILSEGVITLRPVNLTPDEAREHIKLVSKLLKDCDVATLESPPLVRSLFESINDPDILTIFVRNDQEYHDMRTVLKCKDTIIAFIAATMEYYKEKESLNIILSREVMRNRGDTYHRYTAQFAQQIATYTQEFLKIKAIYSAERGELGIFCRKSEFDISVTFFGQLVGKLRETGQVTVNFDEMPDTYVAYPSMLHYKIKAKMKDPKVKMVKLAHSLKFSCEKSKKVLDLSSSS